MGISYEEAATPSGQTYNPPPSLPRSASDWATSFIRGLAKGGESLAGLPGDVSDLVGAGVLKVGHAIGLPDPPEASRKARGTLLPTTETIKTAVEGDGKDKNAIGKFLEKKPTTPGGRYAESVGEFLPGVLGGEGSLARKGIQAVAGGIGSQAGADLLPGHDVAGRVIGGLLGQGLPATVRRAIAPTTVSPEREAMTATLRHEGVEPTAGDVSGSRALKYAEHGLGDAPGSGGAYHDTRERIGEQFTRATLRRVGENADRATPEVVDRAFTRIGGDFDRLSARNSARLDPQYFTELFNAQHEYDHLFVDPLRRPMVQNVIDHAVNQLQRSGTMTGEQYKALRSRIERMRRNARNDPEVADFLGDVRRSMDNLMERNIARNNPADLGAWQQTRRQYRNMLVLEKAATGAGEDSAAGIISPAKLRQALVAQSRRGYARGQGDFADLARAGEGLMKPPPTSGTAERAWMHAIPAAVGAGLGEMAGGNMLALPAAMGGVMAPGLVGRGLMSGSAQAYLKNQIAASLGINPTALDALSPGRLDALVRSALAARSQQQGQRP